LIEIPDNVKNSIEIIPVRWIDKVLEKALETMPKALPEDEAIVAKEGTPPKSEPEEVLKH
jgi:ATP-dependent Lon protease